MFFNPCVSGGLRGESLSLTVDLTIVVSHMDILDNVGADFVGDPMSDGS